jgi:IS30 family transposase
MDNFRELTRRDVSKIARLLNERPRKTLDFRTPYEVFSDLP